MTWISETLTAIAVALGLGGANAVPLAHGYVEGEYLLVAAPASGTLETLSVQDVFLRCLESAQLSEEQREILIGGFNELVSGLEDAESCA